MRERFTSQSLQLRCASEDVAICMPGFCRMLALGQGNIL